MKLETLRQNIGIYIFALWSGELGVLNFGKFLVSSQTQASLVAPTMIPLWQFFLYQWVSIGFSLSFIGAMVGLFFRKEWGRRLFLITVVLFFAISLSSLFLPRLVAPTLQQKWVLSIRYIISAAIALIYFNLSFVKERFNPLAKDDAS